MCANVPLLYRYFVATQDPELRVKVRKVPGTPVMYLHRSAPVLERPSEMSSAAASDAVKERVSGPEYHSRVLEALKKKEFGEPTKAKKRKKKGGPNPLSCLKKKKRPQQQGNKGDLNKTKEKLVTAGKKRKRKGEKKVGAI